MKTMTLPDFLTAAQIEHAQRIYRKLNMDAVKVIREEVIEPNMAEINRKLGQENDASYLAYAVVYVLSQVMGGAK